MPDAAVVVPVLLDHEPALALPYAELELARALAAASEVRLVVTEHPASREAAPVIAAARATLTEDPTGDALEERGLLPQFIAKHPPDRRRIDSMLQRKEHWWYLPRLLVRFAALQAVHPLPAGDGLLLLGDDELTVQRCTLPSTDPLQVDAPLPAADRTALVHTYGADVPDLEQPWQRRWRGVMTPTGFEVDAVDGTGPPSRARSVRERIGVEWRLERACKRGLKAAGHPL